MQKIGGLLVLILLGTALPYLWQRLAALYAPCQRPLAYTIGRFDERFGLARAELLAALSEAEHVWEKPISRDLFNYADRGRLEINLVYDARQAATEILTEMGLVIADTENSYQNLKAQYTLLKNQYDRERAALDTMVSDFEKRKAAYEQRVNDWNSRGGAPKGEYEKLEREKGILQTSLAAIENAQDELNALAEKINALATTMNRLATELNLNVEQYNTVGASRGEEFEEGTYQEDRAGRRINIYEYSSREKLTRVLAHEFGHALGLPHVEDGQAIMYRLNQGENKTPTAADLAELKKVCELP